MYFCIDVFFSLDFFLNLFQIQPCSLLISGLFTLGFKSLQIMKGKYHFYYFNHPRRRREKETH